MSSDNILANLNSSQRAAVSSTARTLAILAGPGSGKTHTLTSRTAWLLKHKGLQPWNIIVATFTVKAAREMKERIGKLIGDGLEAKLVLGTFHSISRRYLARYGHLINIRRDFGIADSSDSLAIIKRIIKRHKLTIDVSAARARISGRKARGAETQPSANGKNSSAKSLEVQEFDTCYNEYEAALKRSNLLDYDDLLLRCVDLLRAYPSCVSNIEAVLIDEFQDTNLVQFDLMRLFAAERKMVTIVGDPDQSIYGFRSAETKNFKRMLKQYPETLTITLEENYRSSGAILLAALEIIQQDAGRIAKSLMPTHNVGTRPVLRKLPSAHVEAQWIITEIKRCLALTGNLMTFDDVAILLRSASLSRHIESALGKAGIAYRMVEPGGHRFYDRVEVKILLDYLRVINQPDNNDALARVVNVPSRQIGDTTVKSLLEEADQSSAALWTLILEKVQGIKNTKTKLSKQTEQGLSSFVNLILTGRKKIFDMAASQFSITDLIDYIIKKTSFEGFLERTHPDDYEARWANIQELINQASDFSDLVSESFDDDEALPEVDGLRQDDLSSPLSKFLANIALASDVKADETSALKAQVTISTIHAAKGLEWPVVFIPATYEGSIPHSRAEDADEERRLLYVAMTRAKALLYLSYPSMNSQREQTTLSQFLTPTSLMPYIKDRGPSFICSVTQSIAQILNRPSPSNIDLGILGTGLDSLEDDLWLGRDDDVGQIQVKWDEWDGDHHYTQGQRPPKRRRLDNEGSSNVPQDAWQPAYSTTMAQHATFSTASVIPMSGFVSAGSHLKVISEKAPNCIVENSAPILSKGICVDASRVNKDVAPGKREKVTKPRNPRRPEGQGLLMNYLTKSNSQSRPTSRPAKICQSKGSIAEDGRANCSGGDVFMDSAPATGNSCKILPSLANHRLGSTLLLAPTRRHYDEDNIKKSYVFLSSSPPAPENCFPTTEDMGPAADPSEVERKGNLEVVAASGNRTAETMHMTTMSHMNTINVPRKTLGVRRSMKRWSHRGGHGFVPPSMSKPS